MKTIRELVRVFCSRYGEVSLGQMPIVAILAGDPCEYLEPSMANSKSVIVKVFASKMILSSILIYHSCSMHKFISLEFAQ